MPIVRVRETVAVQEPQSETWITLVANAPYDTSDPLVRQYPWAFQRDEIEQATSAPGEKRNR